MKYYLQNSKPEPKNSHSCVPLKLNENQIYYSGFLRRGQQKRINHFCDSITQPSWASLYKYTVSQDSRDTDVDLPHVVEEKPAVAAGRHK